MKVETIENGIKVTIPEKENYTLDELEQRLINSLYVNIGHLERYKSEIELLKVILGNSNISSKITLNHDGITTEVGNSQFKVNKDDILIGSSDVTIQYADGTREQVPNTYSYKFETKKD